jgi:parallel beta-helix repeat protein
MNEYTGTTATTTITATSTAFSNKYFVWFTADNADDNSASFSRIDTYSVFGPLSQSEVLFSGSLNLSTPTDNAVTATSPTFTWTSDSSYLGISKYQLYIDGVLDTDNITATSTTPSSALSEGAHTWYVKAVNGGGSATTSPTTRTINVLPGYTSSQTWYVDNVLGDDSNTGTQSSPWKTLTKASATAQPGNTVVIIKNAGVPYRDNIAPSSGNTTDGNITFRGVDANSKPEILGSENVSQSVSGGWSVYSAGNANTYQKSIASTVNVVAAGSATSTLTKRTWENSATSLNKGGWNYSGGVLYYRLNTGEDISTLHIEAGQRNYGVYCTSRNTFKNIIIKYYNVSGANLGVGCIGDGIEIYDTNDYGAILRGSGSATALGPILRYSVIARSYTYGIYMQLPTYARVYNNVVYNNGVGLYVQLWAHNSIIRNNIFTNNTKNIRLNVYSAITNFISSNNNWSSGTVDSSWTNTYKGTNNQASTTPLFRDTSSRNFRLQQLSTDIDAGTSVSGLTTDIIGNPIYGTPDIGAYEYQPPYRIGTDKINISGRTRLYADGKYRYTTATSSTETADITILPKGGWGSGDYSEYMNITINTWNTGGDYKKEWTESSDSAGVTAHTIGDLEPGRSYIVKVDGVVYDSVSANDSGKASFNYTGGYSTHVFTIDAAPIGNGPIFTGPASALPGYKKPRLQTVYPDGTIVYRDTLNDATSTALDTNEEVLPSTNITTPVTASTTPVNFNLGTTTAFIKTTATSTPPVGNDTLDTTQPKYIFLSYLKRGSKNKQVSQLQQTLRKLGFFTYPQNTGYFGKVTETAVKAFQKAHNIETVGMVGPKTREALNTIDNTNTTSTTASIESIKAEIARLVNIVKKLQSELHP